MPAPAELDVHEYESLNTAFYRADPAEVIDARIWMLVRYLRDEDLQTSPPVQGVRLTRDQVPPENERVRFASLEATLIEHQAAETLLRLLLAHWEDAPCPWWELTRLRAPRVFPSRVSKLAGSLDDEVTMSQVLKVVSWKGDRSEMGATAKWQREDGWERHRDGLRDLVLHCCHVILDKADLYNAGKHGLAILPETMGVQLGDGDLISVSGPALTVIERTTAEGDPRWAKVTHWASHERSIAMSALIGSAIRSLWECGKQRRVGGGDLKKVRVFDRERVEEMQRWQTKQGFNVETMKEFLSDDDHPMFTRVPSGPESSPRPE